MEFNEAISAMKQLANSYKAVKKLEEVLDYIAVCKQEEINLMARVERLRKEENDLSLLKQERERLRGEVEVLNKQKLSTLTELNKLKGQYEALKAKFLSL